MTQINPEDALNYTSDVEPVIQQVMPDEEAMLKACTVLNALRAAALQPPFGFDQVEAEPLWAAAIGAIDILALTKAAGTFAEHHHEFPSLAQFMTVANFHDGEHKRLMAAAKAGVHAVCPECDDVLWVTIRHGEDRWARPCSRCLPERYELYRSSHFDAKHIDRGGCPKCWEYLPTLRHKARAARSA